MHQEPQGLITKHLRLIAEKFGAQKGKDFWEQFSVRLRACSTTRPGIGATIKDSSHFEHFFPASQKLEIFLFSRTFMHELLSGSRLENTLHCFRLHLRYLDFAWRFRITESELQELHARQRTFLKFFLSMYGKEIVCQKGHEPEHFADDIRNWGPLSSARTFVFEALIKNMKSYKRTMNFRYFSSTLLSHFWMPRILGSMYPALNRPSIIEAGGEPFEDKNRCIKFQMFAALSRQVLRTCRRNHVEIAPNDFIRHHRGLFHVLEIYSTSSSVCDEDTIILAGYDLLLDQECPQNQLRLYIESTTASYYPLTTFQHHVLMSNYTGKLALVFEKQ